MSLLEKCTIVLFVLLLVGCRSEKNNDDSIEIIKLNPHESHEFVKLSEFADSIKCIKLQTTPGDIMGRVREIIIKKIYIYAIDISQQILFVFDKSGNFVSKLNKRGQAGDEYTLMGPIFIDDDEAYIELIDYKGTKTSKLKYSNISFEFIERVSFPNISCNSCKRIDSAYYFSTQQLDNIVDGEKTNGDLIVLNDNNGEEYVLFDKNIKTTGWGFSPNIESFSKNEENELFVSLMYDNTFYQLKDGKTYPIFSVDFGKYGIDNTIRLESTKEQIDYIQKMNGLASFPVLNINNSDILAFSYYFKKSNEERMYREDDFRQYIKIKKTGKEYHVKQIKNDLTDFPNHLYISSYFFNCAHEVWHENYLVDIVIPNYYFSDDDPENIYVDGIGEVTPYDNPIVVMIKLKE